MHSHAKATSEVGGVGKTGKGGIPICLRHFPRPSAALSSTSPLRGGLCSASRSVRPGQCSHTGDSRMRVVEEEGEEDRFLRQWKPHATAVREASVNWKFNSWPAFPFFQVYQEPKNDGECLSNIKEFLKGCTAFRVEVSTLSDLF